MGPEDMLGLTPGGKVYIVPNGANRDEVMNRGPRELKLTADGDIDWGSDGGLEGGLQGWPDGPLEEVGTRSWSMELTIDSGKPSDVLQALLMGMTVEEYRDLVQWARESRWLKRVTGENWGSFE